MNTFPQHPPRSLRLLSVLRAFIALQVLAILTSIAHAAISFDAASSGGTGTAISASWSHTVGTGSDRMLVVGVTAERDTSNSATSVTFGSQSLTKVPGSFAQSNATVRLTTELWYLPAPDVGTGTITVTFASSVANGIQCGAVSLFGVKQEGPEAVAVATGTQLDAGTSYSVSITTLTAGAWLVDIAANGSNGASFTTTTSGMVERWDATGSGQCAQAGATRPVAAPGTVTDTWTCTNNNRKSQSIAAFAPAPAALAGLTLTAPTNGQNFSVTSSITASASPVDGSAPYTVKFFLKQGAGSFSQVGSDVTSSPYQVSLGTLTAGSYEIYASVTDNVSATATSATHTFTVTDQAPAVAITSPTSGATPLLGSAITVSGTATDDVGLDRVEIYDGATLLGNATLGSGTFSYSWNGATGGAHSLTAKAVDSANQTTTSAAVNITVVTPILVGSSGSGTIAFGTQPTSAQWSTLSVTGAAADVSTETGLDTTMSAVAASSITTTLPSQAGSGALANAYYRSGDQKVGTQPTGNKMTLLMATLQNTSGGTIGGLTVSYTLENLTNSTEQINGHRIYWSKTGLTGSWTAAGSYVRSTTGTSNFSLDLSGVAWANNATLYVVWADDNGDGTEGIYTIDNVSFTPISEKVWTGNSLSNDNWSTGDNWSAALAGGESLRFGSTSRTTPYNDLAAGTGFAALLFDSTAPAYTISGNSIALAGALVNASANDQTVNLPIGLPAAATITSDTNNLTLGGTLSGTGSALTKTGAGHLTLTGSNTYTGATAVNSGTLTVPSVENAGTNSPLGAYASSGAAGLSLSGGTLQYSGTTATTNRGFTLAASSTLEVSQPNTTLSLGATSLGAFTLGVTGTTGSTLDLAAMTLTGAATLNPTTANLTVASVSATNQNLVLGGTAPGNSVTGQINLGTGTLTKTGTGTWTVGGLLTTNSLTISDGRVKLGAANVLQNVAYNTAGATGPIGLDANGFTTPTFGGLGGSVDLATAITGYNNITSLTLNTPSGSTSTYSGAISNGNSAVSLSKTGAGTQILSGVNTFTGATSVSAGILRINSPGSLHASSAVSVSGGGIGGTGTINGNVALNSVGGIDLRDGAIGTLTIGGNLAINGAAGANNLYFDLGTGASTDQIVVGGNVTMANANGGVINFNQLSGGRVTPGSYNLIQASGPIPDLSNFKLATGAAFGSSFTLGLSGTTLQVTTTQLAAGPAAAFWSGAADANWSTAGNWNTSDTSGVGTGAAPSYQSNVTFTTTTPVATNLTNTLDADFDINSLTFNGTTGGVTINGNKTLTIEATNASGNTAGVGIVASAQTSGTNTISSNIGIAANQSWNIGTGGTLTVGGNVTDFGGNRTLRKLGAGTLNLNGTTSVGSLTVGYADVAASPFSDGTVKAGSGASLSVGYGPSSNVYIGVGTGINNSYGPIGTLDTSLAANLTANVGNFKVGGTVGGTGFAHLGGTSTITAATEFSVERGSWGFPNGFGRILTATGSDTTILTPAAYIGHNTPNSTTGGTGSFALGSNASLTLGGINGGRAALQIGILASGNGGSSPDPNIMDLSAGTVEDMNLSSLIVGRHQDAGGNPVVGILTLGSSADNHVDISGAGNVVLVGDSAGSSSSTSGTLTIGNLNATSTVTSTDNSTAILLASKRGSGTPTGSLNLNGGTLTITTTGAAIAGGGGTSNLRLNGTTLKAGASSPTFITSVTNALVHPGGVGFDTNGNDVTVPQALLTPTGGGFGLALTTLTPNNGGSGYTRVPSVSFSTPAGGAAATGYATIDASGQITGIVITSPGSGYTDGQTVTVSLSGSDGSGATFTSPTATVPQTGGGLTKSGAGTLTLGGANTYTGATTVNAGTLALGAAGSLNSSSMELKAGTAFNTSAQSYVIPTAKPVTIHLDSAGAGSSGKITAASLDITNANVVVVIDNATDLDDQAYVLAEYTSLIGSAFSSITAPPVGYEIDYNYNGENKIAWVSVANNDYTSWDDLYAADLSDPAADFDGDGLSNFQEYAFGLDPTSAASSNPISDVSQLKSNGTFTYTRRANSGLTYTIWSSEDLQTWNDITLDVTESPSPIDENTGTQTVEIGFPEPPTTSKLFVRVKAETPAN